jgi:hypothetical protein
MVGITNYFIANVGTVCAAVAMVLAITDYFVHIFSRQISLFFVVIYAILIIGMVWRSLQCMRAQESLLSGKTTRPAELMHYVMEKPGWRFSNILIFLLEVQMLWVVPPSRSYLVFEVIARTFLWLGLAVFYYFIAIDPMPPGTSKARKLVESFMGTPELAAAPAHD